MHHPIDGPDLTAAVRLAAEALRQAGSVAVLTGAGISAESGVPTFRGGDGLWEGHAIEEVATPEGFERNPALVWRFYNARRNALHTVQPNAGHRALVALQDRLGDGFTLITQNVDALHLAAGSRDVLELHGRITRVRCTQCDYLADRPNEPLPDLPRCPSCDAMLRPDIVWFNEMLPQAVWRKAQERAEECDCFLVVGTSAVVYPAAGLIGTARSLGAKVIEFNVEPTAASDAADLSVFGPSGQTLPAVLQRLEQGPNP